MSITRREFLGMLGAAGLAGVLPDAALAAGRGPSELFRVPMSGNVRLLHMTDCHAQLSPVYFREPNVNLGIGDMYGRPPHLVGEKLLERFNIRPGTAAAHAFTYLDFAAAAEQYGRMGGFAHLKTLVNQLRGEAGEGNSLLLDGGDTWQGSGTALWTQGEDMVGACNRLGVDIMTGHWEFTYYEDRIRKNIEMFNGDFVAQNVKATVDALFGGAEVYDEQSGRVFPPYTIKEVGGARIAVVGQAFPYTPIANPPRFIPDWTFGIDEGAMQKVVDQVREKERPDAVVVISHNGMDVDLKMATRVTGIDVILGGHTHDAVPGVMEMKNPGGKTLVTNAGSNGKVLGVMDLEVKNGKLRDYKFHLVPVFSDYLDPDPEMSAYIEEVRNQEVTYNGETFKAKDKLDEELAVADRLLYRRGNFTGTFDQIIVDALREVRGADIALSPGFRWGVSVLPGEPVTMEHVLTQTALTYPNTSLQEMTGERLKAVLEDVCDNLFNKDPYYQQGGDMVRVGGMLYTCDPTQTMGKRISDMQLRDGTPIKPDKTYKVAGWASVDDIPEGPPVFDVVAEYLRDRKKASIEHWDTPRLKNVKGNPGLANYPRVVS